MVIMMMMMLIMIDYHLSRVFLIKPCVGCTEGVARAKGFTVALVPGEKETWRREVYHCGGIAVKIKAV